LAERPEITGNAGFPILPTTCTKKFFNVHHQLEGINAEISFTDQSNEVDNQEMKELCPEADVLAHQGDCVYSFSFPENLVCDDGRVEHLFVVVVNVAVDDGVAGKFSQKENHLDQIRNFYKKSNKGLINFEGL
jgi:hypothetical protein